MPDRFSDDVPRKLRVLKEHCRDAGRDCNEIEKTTVTEAVASIAPEVHAIPVASAG